MEDSSAMTIEFLRARLLSERSVSRTARQRADELNRRVEELEEQLKNVSIQRRKAERAASEVLAVLESHGITDLLETYDSSSDKDEAVCQSKENSTSNEDDPSVATKTTCGGEDGLCGSEHTSLNTGRHLPWKSDSGHLNSSSRKKLAQVWQRRSNRISPTGASPKYRMGKSCREIKRKEPRFLENNKSNAFEEKLQKENSSSPYANGIDGYGDMERALEQQAQLIGQYEAEENAQIEWEDRHKEVHNSLGPQEPQDSFELGNHSDVTEEKNEQLSNDDIEPTGTTLSFDGASKSGKAHNVERNLNGTLLLGHFPADLTSRDKKGAQASFDILDQREERMEMNEHEASFPKYLHPTLECSKHKIINQSKDRELSSFSSSFQASQKSPIGEQGGKQKHFEGTQHRSCNDLGGVLEALQQAKMSLQREISVVLPNRGTTLMLPTSVKPTDGMNISPPSPGASLFRLPTDFENNDLPYRFAVPRTDFGSSRHISDAYFNTLPSSHRPPTPYTEPRPGVCIGQLSLDSHISSGSRHSTIDGYSSQLPSFSRVMAPTSDIVGRGAPLRDQYAFYDERVRSHLYR